MRGRFSRRRALTAGGAAAAGALLGAVTAAPAQADDGPPVVGSWIMKITLSQPVVGALTRFTSVLSFHPGGIVTEARRAYLPPLMESAGHGAWKQTGAADYEAFIRFTVQLAPPSTGTELGTDNVRLTVTLSADGQTLSGTFASMLIVDALGTKVPFQGTVTAERITV